MSDIRDIPIDDIKEFLSINKEKISVLKDKNYDKAWDIIQKNTTTFKPISIIEWAKAHNLIKKNIDVPRYSISAIKELSHEDLSNLSKTLDMKTTNIDNIINILKYMHKLDENVKEEHPVYAVYSRKGPNKILMLIKPRTQEVTYTPTGVEYLKLNKNQLPGYIYSTIVSGQHNKFLTVPYIKGRSEKEIEELRKNLGDEYNIKDIELGDIYIGEYGKVGRIQQTLSSLRSCQKVQTITLSQAPRGTPWYNQFIKLSKNFDETDPGTFVLGKNGDYIITTNAVSFEKVLNDIKKCEKVYYLITVTKDKTVWGEIEETAHAMAFVIDPKNHVLEIFDSNGLTPNTRHVYFWATKLIQYLRKNGINLERKITADEVFCPQGASAFSPDFKGEGQCLVWSFWYIWLRINNPDIPANAIHRYMSNMTPEDAYNRISRIATVAYGSSTDPGVSDSVALYEVKGPRKIIFLYKHSTGEITYTPYGVNHLKLNPQKLPNFVDIYPKIGNPDEYILIPYIKGRSEQEIEKEIMKKTAYFKENEQFFNS